MGKTTRSRGNQKGGGSDFQHNFHAPTVKGGAQAISQVTLKGLSNTPMFNPLKGNTVFPGTTGIVPSGIYLGAQRGGSCGAKHGKQQGGCCGGGKSRQQGGSSGAQRGGSCGAKHGRQQGGGSDFVHSFHSLTAKGGSAAISQATLKSINNTPMFNPLKASTTFAGPSGIIPSGLYLGAQTGGAPKVTTADLRTACNQNGLSCKNNKGGFLSGGAMIKLLKKQA